MECVEVALKNGFLPETHQQHHGMNAGEDMVWAVERRNLLGDDISVDDVDYLLDLGELTEPEKEEEKEAEAESPETENTNSSFSALYFDPAPLILHAFDEAELEWVSRMVDDSFSEFPPCSGVTPYHPAPKTHTPSLTSPTFVPISVKAKRSKRSRTAAAGVWSISTPPPFTDSSTTTTTTSSLSSSSSCSSPSYSSYLIYDHAAAGITTPILLRALPKKRKPKKRGRKPKFPPPALAPGDRRCSHCGVQKTPQWRAGPFGAKTLCNACGVRFKSGRLLPEYRPACSPTFVGHVHSNSHRKVMEMRRKKEEQVLCSAAPPVASF